MVDILSSNFIMLKPFSEETIDDALSIVRDRFGENACEQARLILRNPMRRLGVSAGDVAYEKGCPVGFQAAILRRGLIGGGEFLCVVGGMLAMKEGASPVSLVSLMKSTIKPRGGSVLFLANTSIPTSMKMNRLLGVDGQGGASCGVVRFSILRFGQFARFCLHGRLPRWVAYIGDVIGCCLSAFFLRRQRTNTVPRQLMEFQDAEFDRFWEEYLLGADGIVLSRTAEELTWMFSDGLQRGRNVLLTRNDGNRLVGYIVLRAKDQNRNRWLVVDWIALNNDRDILSDLLGDSVRYLRRNTNAAFLESIGFRSDVQDIVHRHLPFERKAPNNSTIYKAFTDEIDRELKKADCHGWFFGPYDGDRCMA